MLFTSGPAFIIATIVFFVIGLRYNATVIDETAVMATIDGLDGVFNFKLRFGYRLSYLLTLLF